MKYTKEYIWIELGYLIWFKITVEKWIRGRGISEEAKEVNYLNLKEFLNGRFSI